MSVSTAVWRTITLASCVLCSSVILASPVAGDAALVKREPSAPARQYGKPALEKKLARSKGAVAERDWTVLYYLDADCNLEAPMLDDIDEMEMIGSTDQVNLLMLLDRTPDYDERDGNWANSRLYFITRDETDGKIHSMVLDNLREMDTSNPQTLVEFVAFGMQNFPARHYALVLGNHGGTWMGMINDDTDNANGMTLPAFIDALAALKAGGAPKFDLIAFDMCLMSQVEVMDAIAPFAAFGVASEELEPGIGYPNHRVLHALTKNPKMSPREFAQSMVREWQASYAEAGEATVTSAATDLAKMGDVTAAVDALAVALAQASPEVRAAAARARAATEFFGGAEAGGVFTSYDLGQFAARLASEPEAASLKAQIDAVRAAVAAAVVVHAEGEAHAGSTGLAIYFPADGKVHPGYASTPFARGKWDEFLAKGLAEAATTATSSATGAAGSPGSGAPAASPAVTITGPDPGATHRIGGGLEISATVSGAPISIRAAIGYLDKDGSVTGVSDEEVSSPDGRWNDGEAFSFRLAPRVRAISDGKGARLVPMTPLSPGSPFSRADASYNSLMGDLVVSAIFDTRKGTLQTLFCLDEKGQSVPTAVHPVKGERLVFYQPVRGGRVPKGEQRFRPVPALVSSGGRNGAGIRLVETSLPKGEYVLTLTAYDAAGVPAGSSALRLTADGSGVAAGVSYPDYGFPAVAEDDLEWVDLSVIIPAAEYDHFEATWDDYDFMAEYQADDFSDADLAYLDAVALDDEELAFDRNEWSTEFEEWTFGPPGDADGDGTPDAVDTDDDNDGILDVNDDDDDNDGLLDVDDDDEDNDGVPAIDDDDDDGDGVADVTDDDDNDGIPDEVDTDDDNDGVLDTEQEQEEEDEDNPPAFDQAEDEDDPPAVDQAEDDDDPPALDQAEDDDDPPALEEAEDEEAADEEEPPMAAIAGFSFGGFETPAVWSGQRARRGLLRWTTSPATGSAVGWVATA